MSIRPRFLCVGLTPTVQRTMRFASLTLGEVNRAREVVTTASGKAVNVARVLDTLGSEVLLAHPLGGDSGRYVEAALPFGQFVLPVTSPTRTCTTLLTDTGVTTELVEEAAPLSEAQVEDLLAALEEQLPRVVAVALCGSLPPGVAPHFYARIATLAHAHETAVFLDAQKEPLRLALAAGVFLAKPNRQETIAALGLPPETEALGCAQALRAAGAKNALVSDGRAGSVLVTDAGAWRVLPPLVDAVNPIGSGDSLLAGVIAKGWFSLTPEAVAYGTACAAANCLSLTSGVVQRDDVERLLPQVRVEPVQ